MELSVVVVVGEEEEEEEEEVEVEVEVVCSVGALVGSVGGLLETGAAEDSPSSPSLPLLAASASMSSLSNLASFFLPPFAVIPLFVSSSFRASFDMERRGVKISSSWVGWVGEWFGEGGGIE